MSRAFMAAKLGRPTVSLFSFSSTSCSVIWDLHPYELLGMSS
jgi:hypothetical protein